MPSSWLEENDPPSITNNPDAQDTVQGLDETHDGVHIYPDYAQNLAQSNAESLHTESSYQPYHQPPSPVGSSRYADDIDRTDRTGYRDLQYSPEVDNTPVIPDSADRQTRPSDIDSLFGDSQDGEADFDDVEASEAPEPTPSQTFPKRRDGPGGSLPSGVDEGSEWDGKPIPLDYNRTDQNNGEHGRDHGDYEAREHVGSDTIDAQESQPTQAEARQPEHYDPNASRTFRPYDEDDYDDEEYDEEDQETPAHHKQDEYGPQYEPTSQYEAKEDHGAGDYQAGYDDQDHQEEEEEYEPDVEQEQARYEENYYQKHEYYSDEHDPLRGEEPREDDGQGDYQNEDQPQYNDEDEYNSQEDEYNPDPRQPPRSSFPYDPEPEEPFPFNNHFNSGAPRPFGYLKRPADNAPIPEIRAFYAPWIDRELSQHDQERLRNADPDAYDAAEERRKAAAAGGNKGGGFAQYATPPEIPPWETVLPQLPDNEIVYVQVFVNQELKSRHPNCKCGCHRDECVCHPMHCGCTGCDHTKEIEEMKRNAEMKWGEPISFEDDGEAGQIRRREELRKKRYARFWGREPVEEPLNVQDEDEVEGRDSEPVVGSTTARSRKKESELLEEEESEVLEEETVQEEERHNEAEPQQQPQSPNKSQEGKNEAQDHRQCCGNGTSQKKCSCLPGLCRCEGCAEHNVEQSDPSAAPAEDFDTTPTSHNLNHSCPCRGGGPCRCPEGHCRCRKAGSAPGLRTVVTGPEYQSDPPCPCRAGGQCGCSPGKCQCRKAFSAEEPGTLHGDGPGAPYSRTAADWASSTGPTRPLHLRLSERVEKSAEVLTLPPGTLPLMSGGLWPPSPDLAPASSFSRQTPVPPSRPDTPRPPADSTPSTPYAADVLHDYVQQSVEAALPPPTQHENRWSPIRESVFQPKNFPRPSVEAALPPAPQYENRWRPEGESIFQPEYFPQQSVEPESLPGGDDDVRQSVEPTYPPPNWARESTPAYEDRSFTPSPLSRHGDVDMRDPSAETIRPASLGRGMSMPPTSDPEDHRSVSPQRPVPPPIPSSNITQPKRGNRRKSGVHGSKVEKGAATGSKAKPKNRKPTQSVGKLLEKAKKDDKEAVEKDEKDVGSGEDDLPRKPLPKVGGKVAEAVKKIEDQVKQKQEEEEDLKQKDGTPVRRSARANKGVRTSFGYGSPR